MCVKYGMPRHVGSASAADLGNDDQFVWIESEGAPDELVGDVRAVAVGRVNVVDPQHTLLVQRHGEPPCHATKQLRAHYRSLLPLSASTSGWLVGWRYKKDGATSASKPLYAAHGANSITGILLDVLS